MKVISAVFLVSCAVLGALAAPEAPSAPYAPSGWRPKGPSFDLPTRTVKEQQQVPKAYGARQEEIQETYGARPEEIQETGTDIEVSEEEVQYTGEIGTTEATTPFLQYGFPITDLPEEEISPSTEAVEAEEELTVQGLPGIEPAKEFRALPTSDRLRDRRVQRLRAQPKQKTARLQAQPSKQQTQFFQGQFQQQFQQQKQFQRQQVYSTTEEFQPPIQQQVASQQFGVKQQQQSAKKAAPKTQGFAAQQFGRFTVPQQILAPKQRLRPAPIFQQQRFVQSQRQEQAVDTYGAPAQEAEIGGPPAQEYGPPAQEYGPPAQEYGPPAQVAPREETDVNQPEEVEPEEQEPELPQVEDETTEVNRDFGEEEGVDGGDVAISNAVAGRYVLLQETERPAKLRAGRTPKAAKLRMQTNLRQITQPIFTYNQFGQLVRIF